MERKRKISLTIVAAFLFLMIIAGVILHYPLNLIVDGIALGIVGISFLIYVIIWSFLEDRVVIRKTHFMVLSRRFPFWTILERRVYFREISYFVDHGQDTIIVLKRGDLIHINRSETDEGNTINDLPALLKEKRIKELDYGDFIKDRTQGRTSDLSKV
jgi:hypothetical protein